MPFDLQPTLRGELLELRPLAEGDFDALFAVASDPLIWEQHPQSDRYKEEVFREYFRGGMESGGAFLVTDVRDGRVIGSSRYAGYNPDASEIEIGWTFLARPYWGGKYNAEMKRLMLDHAFRFVERVVLLIGPNNLRSQRAAEKIGGVRNGTRIDDTGRESVVFELTRPGRRAVHVLVFDGFADWEPAHALAELRRSGGRTIRTVGFTAAPVVSMGGLRVVPDVALASVRPEDVELLIIPGGDLWEGEAYPRATLESLVSSILARNAPVAAICAGTLALARAHTLDDRQHTSNMPGYLAEHAAEYAGAAHYVERPAVVDRRVITASGLAPVDFARVFFAELAVFSPADEALWFGMFKHGELPHA